MPGFVVAQRDISRCLRWSPVHAARYLDAEWPDVSYGCWVPDGEPKVGAQAKIRSLGHAPSMRLRAYRICRARKTCSPHSAVLASIPRQARPRIPIQPSFQLLEFLRISRQLPLRASSLVAGSHFNCGGDAVESTTGSRRHESSRTGRRSLLRRSRASRTASRPRTACPIPERQRRPIPSSQTPFRVRFRRIRPIRQPYRLLDRFTDTERALGRKLSCPLLRPGLRRNRRTEIHPGRRGKLVHGLLHLPDQCGYGSAGSCDGACAESRGGQLGFLYRGSTC